jgi:hypothetical protein
MSYKNFLSEQSALLEDIKKSLYRAVEEKEKKTKDAIVADIADDDMVAEVPKDLIPANKQAVMNKSKEKGVHKPYMEQGESFAGEMARQGKQSKDSQKKAFSRDIHKLKSKEIKDIKPKLPKNECSTPDLKKGLYVLKEFLLKK